jgi:hypothetical protein
MPAGSQELYVQRLKKATKRQMLLAQPRAGLRSEPISSIPSTTMEIATEMARFELEMREGKDGKPKQRVELLAEHFLRVTGQSGESCPIDRSIEIGRGQLSGVHLTVTAELFQGRAITRPAHQSTMIR